MAWQALEEGPDSKSSTTRPKSSEEYLKWKFSKKQGKKGVYFEYERISPECPLTIPDTLLGAVLGYGACAPVPKDGTTANHPKDELFRGGHKIMNAISISFDGVGYGTTLARTFNWVGSVNFSSKFDPNAKSPVELTKFYTNMISLVCRADVLSADADIQTQLEKPLRNLWFPVECDEMAYETSFIVLGPIPTDNPGHHTTVDLFLDKISECLGKDAVLLTLKPMAINGKNVKHMFLEYVPRESRFVQHKLIIRLREDSTDMEWKARKSAQPIFEPRKTEKEHQGAALTAQKPKEGTHLLQMEGDDTSESEPESKERESKHPKHTWRTSESKPVDKHKHTFDLMCGQTKVKMMFTTYRSAGYHYRERRKTFLPVPPQQIDVNVVQPPSSEPSVKEK